MQKIPTLNMRGTFKVLKPFFLPEDGLFTVESIRSVSSMESAGIDVRATVYGPCISESEYKSDLAKNPQIVELLSDKGSITYVPTTYILSLPETGVPQYMRTILSIDLGILPMNEDLVSIEAEVAEIASSLLGVTPTVNAHRIGYRGEMTKQLHVQLTEQREVAKSEGNSTLLENIKLRRRLMAQAEYIRKMET